MPFSVRVRSCIKHNNLGERKVCRRVELELFAHTVMFGLILNEQLSPSNGFSSDSNQLKYILLRLPLNSQGSVALALWNLKQHTQQSKLKNKSGLRTLLPGNNRNSIILRLKRR